MKITTPCHLPVYQRHTWGKKGVCSCFENLSPQTIVLSGRPEVAELNYKPVVILPFVRAGFEYLILPEMIDDELRRLTAECLSTRDVTKQQATLARMNTRLLKYAERTLQLVT